MIRLVLRVPGIRMLCNYTYKNMEGMAKLEERVGKLEFVLQDGAHDIVREFQTEILKDLYKIREAHEADLKDLKETTDRKDNKNLYDEIEKLRDENARLNYRVLHLKRNLVQ